MRWFRVFAALLTAIVAIQSLIAGPSALGAGSKTSSEVLTISMRPTAPGEQLWAARYNGPENLRDGASDLGVSPDGSTVFVTGRSGMTGRRAPNYATAAYDAVTGDELWAVRYSGPRLDIDPAPSLGVSPDGTLVFITGVSREPTSDFADFGTVAYDAATGAQVWESTYDGPDGLIDLAYALSVSPNGKALFVTGLSGGLTTDADYATVAYDTATGGQQWAARYSGPPSSFRYDAPADLGVSPDGSAVFVTGRSSSTGLHSDVGTVAYDAATGNQLWVRRYNDPANGNEEGDALSVSPDGATVFVSGGGDNPGATTSIAYDSTTGARRWLQRFNDASNRYNVVNDLAVSLEGSAVFVTGYGYGSVSDNGGSVNTAARAGDPSATVAYDSATGARLWVRRYRGPVNLEDVATAVGVSPDGSTVFVTGQTQRSAENFDFTTFAYDAATGTRRWVRRYNGPENGWDGATAVGLSPDGSMVFVTGYSSGSTTPSDYATVAYGTM